MSVPRVDGAGSPAEAGDTSGGPGRFPAGNRQAPRLASTLLRMSNQLDVKRSADRCVTQPDPAPRTVLISPLWAHDGIQAWEDAFLSLPPMVSAPGGQAVGGPDVLALDVLALDVLALDGDGRIRADHRFIEAS